MVGLSKGVVAIIVGRTPYEIFPWCYFPHRLYSTSRWIITKHDFQEYVYAMIAELAVQIEHSLCDY